MKDVGKVGRSREISGGSSGRTTCEHPEFLSPQKKGAEAPFYKRSYKDVKYQNWKLNS
jgi:hypothetical protein